MLLGKTEDRRRRGRQRMRWLDGITDSMDMTLGKLWEMVRDREAWHACSPWGCKELHMTEQLNKNSKKTKCRVWNWRVWADTLLHRLLLCAYGAVTEPPASVAAKVKWAE